MVGMNSEVTRQFRTLYRRLPPEIRQLARSNYLLWKENPLHPGLHFKKLRPNHLHIWSVRIGSDYRALAYIEDELATWFWIGTHQAYDGITGNLRAVANRITARK